MAAATFSSDVIKRMAETGDRIDLTETIESGDTNVREEGVILRKRKHICIACGNEFSQWRSLIRREKYHCKGFETGKKERCQGCGKWLNKTAVKRHGKSGCPKYEQRARACFGPVNMPQ